MNSILKITVVISFLITAVFADYSINKRLLEKSPLEKNSMSFENGGNKHAIDAYSDGIGTIVVSSKEEMINNSLMNMTVFVSGEQAKAEGITLKEYLEKSFGIGTGNNIEIISKIDHNSNKNIGEPCDDNNSSTYNDIYIDINGTCEGITNRTENKCLGEEIGSEIIVNGVSYLVVDNSTIKEHLSRAETLCTSNVTNMSYLFTYVIPFNQNISSWDVSNVTDMSFMFFGSSDFNKDISKWNTSKVSNMAGMFYNATSFNQNISSWNVSSIKTPSSIELFSNNSSLETKNKPHF